MTLTRMILRISLIVTLAFIVASISFAAAPASPPAVQRETIKATGTLTFEDMAWGYQRGYDIINYDYLPTYDYSTYKVKAIFNDGELQHEAIYKVLGLCLYSVDSWYYTSFKGIIVLEGELIKGNVFPPVNFLLIDNRGQTVSSGESDFIISDRYRRYGVAYRKRDYLLIYISPNSLDYANLARLDLDGGAGKVTIKNVLGFPEVRRSLSCLRISKDFGEQLKLEYTMRTKRGTVVNLNWLDFCSSSIGFSITSPIDQTVLVSAVVSDGIGFKTTVSGGNVVYEDITAEGLMEYEDRKPFYILEDVPKLLIDLTVTEDALVEGKTPIITKKSLAIDLKSLPRELYHRELEMKTPIASCLIQGKKAQVPRPVVWQDQVYVHIRSLFEALGYKVEYVEEPARYKVSHGSTTFEISCDPEDGYLIVDGRRMELDHPIQELINEQLYMHISVLEMLGMKVSWDENNCVLAVE